MGPSENGPARGQHWDSDRYARNGRFVADLGAALLDLLDPQPNEVILDLGCGDGAQTAALAERCMAVVGVDSSAEQIAAARRRGLDARLADGHDLAFEAEFDAILTNAALHWMKRPDAVIDGMWRALRPGGRLAGEMGGRGNVARIWSALSAALGRRGIDAAPLQPWYFPDVDEYRGRLAARGFQVVAIELIDRPTTLPGDIAAWLETFAEPLLLEIDQVARPALIEEVRQALLPELFRPGTGWVADYVRLRFMAVKPAELDR